MGGHEAAGGFGSGGGWLVAALAEFDKALLAYQQAAIARSHPSMTSEGDVVE